MSLNNNDYASLLATIDARRGPPNIEPGRKAVDIAAEATLTDSEYGPGWHVFLASAETALKENWVSDTYVDRALNMTAEEFAHRSLAHCKRLLLRAQGPLAKLDAMRAAIDAHRRNAEGDPPEAPCEVCEFYRRA